MIWLSGTDPTPADSIQVTLSKEDFKKGLLEALEARCVRMYVCACPDTIDGIVLMDVRPLFSLVRY